MYETHEAGKQATLDGARLTAISGQVCTKLLEKDPTRFPSVEACKDSALQHAVDKVTGLKAEMRKHGALTGVAGGMMFLTGGALAYTLRRRRRSGAGPDRKP